MSSHVVDSWMTLLLYAVWNAGFTPAMICSVGRQGSRVKIVCVEPAGQAAGSFS